MDYTIWVLSKDFDFKSILNALQNIVKFAPSTPLTNVRFGALADVTIFIEKASICSKYYPAREP